MKEVIEGLLRRLSKRALVWILAAVISGLASILGPLVYSAEKGWRDELEVKDKAFEIRLDANDVRDAAQDATVRELRDLAKETRDDMKEVRRMLEQARKENK